jgi:hypothetical protein
MRGYFTGQLIAGEEAEAVRKYGVIVGKFGYDPTTRMIFTFPNRYTKITKPNNTQFTSCD